VTRLQCSPRNELGQASEASPVLSALHVRELFQLLETGDSAAGCAGHHDHDQAFTTCFLVAQVQALMLASVRPRQRSMGSEQGGEALLRAAQTSLNDFSHQL